jgi:hypothetical protein
MNTIEVEKCKKEQWYINLKNEEKYVFDLINKYHKYFSKQDKKYRKVVRMLKVILLFFAMSSTIVLGLKTVIEINVQVVIGLILSSLITFTTAISSYFNFEEYWMRNISIHIELNIIRDNFMFDAKAERLDENLIEHYRNELDDIQHKNICYWEKAIKKI